VFDGWVFTRRAGRAGWRGHPAATRDAGGATASG